MQSHYIIRRGLNAALSLLFVACGTDLDDTAERAGELASFDRVHADASVAVQGYVHSSGCSKFNIGVAARSALEGSFNKVIGAEGVLATNEVTGAVRGILNGGAAAERRPALSKSADVHNARVLKYFTECGLPVDQIGQAQVLTLMAGDGPTSAQVDAIRPTFVAYTTVITRQIDGIPVPDSFAAARFNADDQPTMEWVYWPAIPKQVVSDAKTMQAALADPAQRALILANLPAAAWTAQQEIAIRHSDFADESPFRAFGSLDVHIKRDANGGLRGRTRNIDIRGQELIHPNRRPAEAATMQDTAKTK